ncbi:MAG: MerR family transcriptional regulator [Solirubrobacterales bacterium]|nr:MerR family transcriptional regulator [Solirubrobacterales bacterium]
MTPRRPLRIGEVAELTGTTPRTIRYYEELGLLPNAPEREPGAHRTYEPEDAERLRELLELKSLLGITLDELRELAAAETARSALRREWHGGIDDPARRREAIGEALHHVARQLDLVRRRRDAIAELEAELVTKRRRLRALMRELEGDPAATG